MKKIFNKYKKHIPNILTTLRLIAVPVFWGLTLSGNPLAATILFGSACITDALDGYLARHWKVESIYGKITDPLADKMLVMSALLLNGITANKLMLLPFALESGIAVVNIKDFIKDVDIKKLFNREYINELVSNKNKVKVSQTGREKTIVLMPTVSLSLLNFGLNLHLDKILNLLILLTSTMESATFVEYLDAKIINKSDSNMRFPDFVDNKENDNSVKEHEIKLEENISNVKEETDLNRQEKIDILKKEKDILLNKSDIKNKKKSKRFK